MVAHGGGTWCAHHGARDLPVVGITESDNTVAHHDLEGSDECLGVVVGELSLRGWVLQVGCDPGHCQRSVDVGIHPN